MQAKSITVYVFLVFPLLAGIVLLLLSGKTLAPSNVVSLVQVETKGDDSLLEKFNHPLPVLLLQILVILTVSKLIGIVFKRIGQPAVMGEITAGILLGPSLLGWLFPGAMNFLFAPTSLQGLQMLSQIGLLLFMFIIGLEVDLAVFKSRAIAAVVISHVSIVLPYFLGVWLAWFLYSTYAPANIPFMTYALFMGIAMSITAFPVLARILKERKMTQTPVGSLSLLSAAINDVTGWCLLVVVIAVAKAGSISNALMVLVWSLIYVLVMWFLVKPLLARISAKRFVNGKSDIRFTGIVFFMLIVSSLTSELIGIHALFGAFLAGVIMPPSVSVRSAFAEKMEDVSVTLLLPLFFAATGLRTEIGVLNEAHLWWLCVAVIVLAVAGKFLGSAIAARLVGQTWKDSWSIGALMNTRGLMELIVLNIGYDLGILTTEIFTILVLMALVTTLMTGPALNLIETVFKKK